MKSTAWTVSWVTLAIVAALVIASGAVMLFAPELFLDNEFSGYTGLAWEQFAAANPAALSFFMVEAKEMGLFMVTLGILVLGITLFAYRARQRWAWYLLLIAMLMGAGGPVIFNWPPGDMVSVALAAVLLLAGLVALALGAKPVLGRTTEPAAQPIGEPAARSG